MHGLVMTELKKHVEQAYGGSTWTALLHAAGLGGQVYSAMAEYPDEEVGALVQAASKATGTSVATVLEGFGRFLAPDLIATYGFLVPKQWGALDLIENTETTIHTVVRTRGGGARPPVLRATRVSDSRVQVRYESDRRLCALARGIALGVGDHFGTPLHVTESVCMNSGGPYCLLDVTGSSVPAPRGEAVVRMPVS